VTIDDDQPTGAIAPPSDVTESARGPGVLPALTIIWHPDLDRAGEIAPLTELVENEVAPLTRTQPKFRRPGSDDSRPIGHTDMNRRPALEVSASRGIFELRRGTANAWVEVDGVPFDKTRRISSEDLRRGVILTVGGQFVFCLHEIQYPITRGPDLGLLGTSDAIEEVRRAIVRVANRRTPQLIRGESGTGKELAAEALHAASSRSSGPFIPRNMALLRPERAPADLFGYKKGAFTGAAADSPGYFQAADGGTLFLDELGQMLVDVQPMLLRVVEDGVVQPLGSPKALKVDVRIVAATDAKLEQAVAAGRFDSSLYNRFTSRSEIKLPPLRDRREDIGVLLVHFLRQEIGDGELHRLHAPDKKNRPWLSPLDIAAVALSPLSRNVRSLAGLAEDLAGAVMGTPRGDAHRVIADFLNRDLRDGGTVESIAAQPHPPPRQAGLISDQLLAALESTDWDRTRAKEMLNVSRTTFWRWLGKYPALRSVAYTSVPDLRREIEVCGDDLDLVAKKLRTSVILIRRRLGHRG
jgi:two-component system, NtrC family, nitrogen regulation response regulator GlnG